MQGPVKNSVEGLGRLQVAESQVHAGSALSKRKREVAGNESIDPGRGAQVSPPSDTQSESFTPTKHRGEGISAGQGATVDKSLGRGPRAATFQNGVTVSSYMCQALDQRRQRWEPKTGLGSLRWRVSLGKTGWEAGLRPRAFRFQINNS